MIQWGVVGVSYNDRIPNLRGFSGGASRRTGAGLQHSWWFGAPVFVRLCTICVVQWFMAVVHFSCASVWFVGSANQHLSDVNKS